MSQEYEEWLRAGGATWHGVDVQMRKDGQRGLYAVENITRGSVLVHIPDALHFAVNTTTNYGDSIAALAMSLLQAASGSGTDELRAFAPFVRSLPNETVRSVLLQEDEAALLGGSLSHDLLLEYRDHTRDIAERARHLPGNGNTLAECEWAVSMVRSR